MELRNWIGKRIAELRARDEQQRLQEHFEKLRSLPEGAFVGIKRECPYLSKYKGEQVIKIRTLRRNSVRVKIRTSDDKEWHWPMVWLEGVDRQPKGLALSVK